MDGNYDVIVVGGGPAGLSAALVLGRSCRSVLVCDAGEPRNERSRGLHGYLTRDGILPADFLSIGREQLAPYGVDFIPEGVSHVARDADGFTVTLASGARHSSRKLLLATGVRDHVPDIPGFAEMFGRSIHHCPYCDGWEWRGKAMAAYGKRSAAFGLALSLKTWSHDVMLLTGGPGLLSAAQRQELQRFDISVRERRIARLEGTDHMLERVVFDNGESIARDAIFLNTGAQQQCTIAAGLGCVLTHKGVVKTGNRQETNIPGLYVAGDASKDVQMVIVAASEGVKAAQAINEEMQREERHARAMA